MTRAFASPCGLYCRECKAVKDGLCKGCRSSQGLCLKYRKVCGIYMCAKEKDIEFCFECTDFPCIKFKEFFKTPIWYNEVTGNLRRMKEVGVDKWVAEQEELVNVLERCSVNKGVNHCSECKEWPCNKLSKPPLVPD